MIRILTSSLLIVLTSAGYACGDTFRIATYNLNWGNRRGDEVLNAVAEADADIICFQETTTQSEQFLRRHLKKTHPHFHTIGHNGRYAAERFAFASRVQLTDLTFVPPTVGLFGFYSAKAQLSDRSVHIINVHLTPVQLKRGDGFRDVMAALTAAEQKHATEIKAVLQTVDRQTPTVVLGDFNSLSSFTAPQQLVRRGLTDAVAAVHNNADSFPTWTWPTRPLPLALRIDYIFHTAHLKTTDAAVIRRDGSDHALVVAQLKHVTPSPANPAATGPPSE